jgi:hypothetical protein
VHLKIVLLVYFEYRQIWLKYSYDDRHSNSKHHKIAQKKKEKEKKNTAGDFIKNPIINLLMVTKKSFTRAVNGINGSNLRLQFPVWSVSACSFSLPPCLLQKWRSFLKFGRIIAIEDPRNHIILAL